MPSRLHGGADTLRGRGHPLTTHRARKGLPTHSGMLLLSPGPWNLRCRQPRGRPKRAQAVHRSAAFPRRDRGWAHPRRHRHERV